MQSTEVPTTQEETTLFAEKDRIDRLSRIREPVFGSLDGLLVPLGVVSGVAGGTGSSKAVLVAGLAEAFAGALSTGAGEFIAARHFQTHGPWFIIIGRHIPGLRVPITVFCGISQVRYRLFLASTMVSVVFWIAFWLLVGAHLGPKTVHLLHGGHWYTILIPLGMMLGAVLIVRTVMRFRTIPVAR